jgi:hypothetical protein
MKSLFIFLVTMFIFTGTAKSLDPAYLNEPANESVFDHFDNFMFYWTNVPGATEYNLQISDQTDFSNLLIDATRPFANYYVNYFSPLTTYFWHVRAINDSSISEWSDEYSFTTGSTICLGCGLYNGSMDGNTPYANIWTQARIQMLIRANEIGTFDTDVFLNSISWDVYTVNNNDGMTNFTIKIKQTNATEIIGFDYDSLTEVYHSDYYTPYTGWNTHEFTTPFLWNGVSNLLVDVCFNDGVYNYSESASTNCSNLDWAACIYSGSDNNGYMCSPNGPQNEHIDNLRPNTIFSQTLVPLQAPTLVSPVNNSTGNPIEPVLMWNTVTGAASYEVQVSISSSFSTLIKDEFTENPFFPLTNLNMLSTYYWRIKSLNTVTSSPWSEIWNFQTEYMYCWCIPEEIYENSTVVVPANINPTIDGRQFTYGDAIGLFYEITPGQWACAGYEVWNGNNLAITVRGDDPNTPVIDGYTTGEIYQYRVWDGQTQTEYPAIVTYMSGPDNYQVNAFTVLSSLSVITPNSTNKVSGIISYNNEAGIPMSNCVVNLMDENGISIDQTNSDNTGYYEFSSVHTGTYTTEITTDKAWGGLNMIDASITRQKIAFLTEFTPLQIAAADVNLSNSVNMIDVGLMRQKIAFLNPPQWLIPNYVFEKPTVVVYGFDVTVNIKALCAGDVNGSFIPSE